MPVRGLYTKHSSEGEMAFKNFRRALSELEMVDSNLYVDIQYLQSDKGPIIKEFSVESDQGPNAWITVLSPPQVSPLELENKFICRETHGMNWDVGTISEASLVAWTQDIFTPGRIVIVEGKKKRGILTDMLGVRREDVCTYKGSISASLNNFQVMVECPYHINLPDGYHCARRNAHFLAS